jgi:glutathione S-transferase
VRRLDGELREIPVCRKAARAIIRHQHDQKIKRRCPPGSPEGQQRFTAMKLLQNPASPFARKVRAAAIELGLGGSIELELTLVAPCKPNRDYASSHNPLRKIPALVTDGGVTIFDSTVICEYLDALAGGGRLVPPGGDARWRVLTNHALAQGMCEAAIMVRYETALRPETLRWPELVQDQWDRVDTGIGWFERHAAELEEPVNLAHLMLGCTLGYLDFRWPERDWRGANPAVAAWFAALSQRPSFTLTAPENPPVSL